MSKNNSAVDQKSSTKLNLSNQGIRDSDNVFDELSTLEELVELDISGNQLTFLPRNLSTFRKLQSLDIQNNPFQNVKISK